MYVYIPFANTTEHSFANLKTSLDEITEHINDNQDTYSWNAESYQRWWAFDYTIISKLVSHDAISNNRVDHFAKYLGTDEKTFAQLDYDKIRVKKYAWDENVDKNGEEYEFPTEFDLRKLYEKECKSINKIRDQGNCGNAWAVASASAISDLNCISILKTSGKFEKTYDASARELMTCSPNLLGANGCELGNIKWAFEYWATEGVPSGGDYFEGTGCKPYSLPPCLSEKYACNFIR